LHHHWRTFDICKLSRDASMKAELDYLALVAAVNLSQLAAQYGGQ
jgi:hypothetical protein